MEFHLLPIFTFLSLALVASHAALTPEAYWKSVLPNTPMPKAVMDLLHPEWIEDKSSSATVGKSGIDIGGAPTSIPQYARYATEDEVDDNANQGVFFLENDMKPGAKMNLNLNLTKSTNRATFLPRQVAESIPFSSNKMKEILNHFSVKPNSVEAEIMKKTIKDCEEPGIKGEDTYCATSLESMIDFSKSKLGNNVNVQVISSVVEKKSQVQKYSVVGTKKMVGEEAVVCHKQNYVYAVFYCHKIRNTKVYMLSLVGADGTKAKEVAVCHTDTSQWNPKHLALQLLKVKPGTVPICHFLPADHIVWVAN